MKWLQFSLVFFILFFQSCIPNDAEIDEDFWDTWVPFEVRYNTFSMPVTDKWASLPDVIGKVNLMEASGLSYSRKNPGKVWTHQDSGNTNMLFLLDAHTGEILVRYRVDGTVNIDWEDMEISDGPEPGESYLYLSDTGDNQQRRNSYTIYRFKEPLYSPEHLGQTLNLSNVDVETLNFQYPDGSRDGEGMFVDPQTLDIFLTTKRDAYARLYVIPYPQKIGAINLAIFAGEFGFRESSAATVNQDGTKVMIKNRQDIFYWEKEHGESMVEMLSRTPIRAPYIGEPQGEAICFDLEDNYFTLSEALNSTQQPNLYKYIYQP
ncbi:hypothetical protein [Mongoliitalea daihaiensis]|uniref:hypothetical protein n=1 Tax=Mongoliitalea daihaiensis TaxID=2782006 RepID=UPI001F158163|nr:hypothetical protein [Mongoliitalea daihaiensis]UJP66574.1 hypothetical protein IPZ59_08270 [Mongoliitalea daihaiensis]